MSAPKLTRALTLEHAVRMADGAGGFSLTWEPLGTLWAEVKTATGRERGGVSGPVSVGRYGVTVRATPVGSASRPVAGQRFRDGVRLFAIRAVSEADAEGRFLICQTEEEAPQ